MRRSFRDDPVYRAIFSEYMHEMLRRGHSIEFFVEGGRTRTGRLLRPRHGMLQMTLASQARGLPKPIAIVPVYIGYEKLVEANSYLAELRGRRKRSENLRDVVRNLRLLRQRFGGVMLRFGTPFEPADDSGYSSELAREVVRRINASAHVNPVNLVAMATLSMPRNAIDEATLQAYIGTLQRLIRLDAPNHDHSVTDLPPADVIDAVEALGFVSRETDTEGVVVSHDADTAVLMTWYRNNVVHVLATPALIACLIVNRRRPLGLAELHSLVAAVSPYIGDELSYAFDSADTGRWINHMVEAGLITKRDDTLTPRRDDLTRQVELRLLANTIMPTLERFYITAALLAQSPQAPLTRDYVLERARAIAERLSKLYGLNAPEFFDPYLFEGFVQSLQQRGVVHQDDDGHLQISDEIPALLRAARPVISTDVQQTVAREGNGAFIG